MIAWATVTATTPLASVRATQASRAARVRSACVRPTRARSCWCPTATPTACARQVVCVSAQRASAGLIAAFPCARLRCAPMAARVLLMLPAWSAARAMTVLSVHAALWPRIEARKLLLLWLPESGLSWPPLWCVCCIHFVCSSLLTVCFQISALVIVVVLVVRHKRRTAQSAKLRSLMDEASTPYESMK